MKCTEVYKKYCIKEGLMVKRIFVPEERDKVYQAETTVLEYDYDVFQEIKSSYVSHRNIKSVLIDIQHHPIRTT